HGASSTMRVVGAPPILPRAPRRPPAGVAGAGAAGQPAGQPAGPVPPEQFLHGFTVDIMSHPAADRDDVEQHFADSVLKLRAATPAAAGDRDPAGAVRPGSALTAERCLELFGAQLTSRHLDLAARWLPEYRAGCYP